MRRTHLRAELAQLGPEGCPACNLVEESAARWTGWFIAEGNAEDEAVRALRASLGPCARHTRRLVAARGGADVFARAAVDVAREALRRAEVEHVRSPCPACAREAWAEEHATALVLRALGHPGPEVQPALERRLCFPHLLTALQASADAAVAQRLAQAGVAALQAAEGDELLSVLCGRDGDAAARADHLRAASLPERRPGLRRWVIALLEVDACPSCLAERETVRGALEWLATPSELEPWELRLCAGHLAMLRALDPPTARRVAAALGTEWSGALARFAAALPAPAAGQLGRWRQRRAAQEALRNLLGNRACRACEVARAAATRTGALLLAAVRDPELASVYGRSHGVCMHHLSAMPAAAHEGPPGQILRARLALLGWELAEAERKRSWFTRWEPAGSEATAWRRLPGLLGGAEAGIFAPASGSR
jgi:hypothetical protein